MDIFDMFIDIVMLISIYQVFTIMFIRILINFLCVCVRFICRDPNYSITNIDLIIFGIFIDIFIYLSFISIIVWISIIFIFIFIFV